MGRRFLIDVPNVGNWKAVVILDIEFLGKLKTAVCDLQRDLMNFYCVECFTDIAAYYESLSLERVFSHPESGVVKDLVYSHEDNAWSELPDWVKDEDLTFGDHVDAVTVIATKTGFQFNAHPHYIDEPVRLETVMLPWEVLSKSYLEE